MTVPSAVSAVTSRQSGTESRRHDQRVVAGRGERVGEPGEDAVAPVADLGRLAVHHPLGPLDPAAVELADALVAEADAEHRHAALAEVADRVVREPGVLRPARAGRDEHRVRLERPHLVEAHRVVAVDDGLGAELTEVLDEVVDERVVVVDHQHPGAHDGDATGAGPTPAPAG